MQARVVVVGSGIVGSSVALHLVKAGWKDIVVLDKGPLIDNDGSTSHAPGGVVVLSHNKLLTQLANYGASLYKTIADLSPDRINTNCRGGIDLAVSERRWADLQRLHGEAIAFGAEARLVRPEEAVELHPYLDPSSFVGGIYAPNAQLVAAPMLNGGIQRDAAAGGAARFIGHTEVLDVEVAGGRVVAVLTSNPGLPRIECEQVVLATNIWGPLLGDKLGVPVPLLGYEHQYIISHPLEALARFDRDRPEHEVTLPTIREVDNTLYLRQHWDSFGVGSYKHAPRPVSAHRLGQTAKHEFTFSDFLPEAWPQIQRVFPALRGTDPHSFPVRYNGIFAFPVDGMPIVGPTAVAGLWTALGSWLTHGAGVGKTLAEWMVDGEPEWDPRQLDVNRFHPFASTPAYLERICNQNYREIYEIIHPRQAPTVVRNVRLSPFHPRHLALGAEFTVFAGIELPNWYAANAPLVDRYREAVPSRTGWASEFWSEIQGAEHLATRESVALFDLHGLSIIEVAGADAAEFVERLCANKVARKVGSLVYTTWLTPRGGVRRDLAVARMADDRFWMFVGEGSRPRDLDWVRRAATGSVTVGDISDGLTALGLWGPNSRKVLEKVTSADVSNQGFPYFTSRWIDIGTTRALALRVSYAGELGWELHIPVDAALGVWDLLWEAGQEFEIIGAGMGAFDSLRLEKGYRGWGTDVHTEYDAYESGLGWTVRLDKDDFIGAEASRQLSTSPLRRTLTCLTFDDRDGVAMGYEPIMAGDDCVGFVTSSNFGYSVGAQIAYGYLPPALAVEGTRLEIVYFGRRFGVTVAPDPLFDPKMERMKA